MVFPSRLIPSFDPRLGNFFLCVCIILEVCLLLDTGVHENETNVFKDCVPINKTLQAFVVKLVIVVYILDCDASVKRSCPC